MNYHCGNEAENPYNDTNNEGGINRNTRSGAGIHKEDLIMFNGEIMSGKIRKGGDT